jgi:DNA-binding CsgD family transcriptional regulator
LVWLRRNGQVLAAILALAAGLTSLDHAVDGVAAEWGDLAVDFLDRLLLLSGVWFIAILVSRVSVLGRDAERLGAEMRQVSEAAAGWRRRSRRLLDGLSEAVAAQFRDWGLTPAEADIAGLMLKGLPLADIAALRRTSEATIRQQAQAIYRKSGLANRSEFAAYFLEDLFSLAEDGVGGPGAADRPPDRYS